ncbi:MAG: GNAT family N-acetyltransferase [Candidatus Hodarchaeales archaeon]
MELVKNNYIYWEFIRNLRNMDGVREGFIQQSVISKEQHEEYMLSNGNYFWICLDNRQPIGYIGIINYDIRIATHPNHQAKGVASFMLNEVMKKNPNAIAKVKIDNFASLRLFEKCGFVKKYYILEKDDNL